MSTMKRSWKVLLLPTKKQEALLRQCAGAARAVYNAAVLRNRAELEQSFKDDKLVLVEETGEARKPYRHERIVSTFALSREINATKRADVPWLMRMSKHVAEGALKDYGAALFRWTAKDKSGKYAGFPKLKSRKNGLGGFQVGYTRGLIIANKRIRVPKLGDIKLSRPEYWPTQKVTHARITEDHGKWWITCSGGIEVPEQHAHPGTVVGVDVGVTNLLTPSDAPPVENPRALQRAQKKLRRLQRTVSRRLNPGKNKVQSKNHVKAKKAVAQLHKRIRDVRSNTIHQATAAITKRKETVVRETLNVKGMLKDEKIALQVADAAMKETHRQLDYKARRNGGFTVAASRWYPSSKRCSAPGCGHVKASLGRGEKEYRCEKCGMRKGRDENAASNLEQWPSLSPEDQKTNVPRGLGAQVGLLSKGTSRSLSSRGGTGATQVASGAPSNPAQAGSSRKGVRRVVKSG